MIFKTAPSDRTGYLFLLPAFLVISVVALYPAINVLWLSLHRKLLIFGISTFVGFDNFLLLSRDPRFWNSVWNTVYFTLVSVSLELFLGLAIALTLRRAFRGEGWIRAMVLLPWVIPTVVSAKMWEWMYNVEFGVINYLFGALGIVTGKVNWLGDSSLALHAAILADVWKTTPFAALLLLAGLQIIPAEVREAATVDGASRWQIFRRVTLPLLTPIILIVLLFRSLDAFRIFDLVYVLTNGGPANTTETLSVYAYKLLFSTMEYGYGSAVGVFVFISVMSLSLLYIQLLRKHVALLT